MPFAIPSGIQAALKNSGWLLLEKGLRIILIITVMAWVARYLWPGAIRFI